MMSMPSLPSSSLPFRLDDTKESIYIEQLLPRLEQVNVLLEANRAATTADRRRLCLGTVICMRMCFDHRTFSPHNIYLLEPVSAIEQGIFPAALKCNSIALAVFGGVALELVDTATGVLEGPNGEVVSLDVYHCLGNILLVSLPCVAEVQQDERESDVKKVKLEKIKSEDGVGEQSAVAPWQIKVTCQDRVISREFQPSCKCSEIRAAHHPINHSVTTYPLHYHASTNNTQAVLEYLYSHSKEEVNQEDRFGITPAAIALFNGNRVVFTSLVWKIFNWPVDSVAQLIRSRLELEAGVISAADFEARQEFIRCSVFGEPMRDRVRFDVGFGDRASGSFSSIVGELPSVTHPRRSFRIPGYGTQDGLRRGSLDILLSAIQNLESGSGAL